MTTGIEIRHYTTRHTPRLRPLLLDIYAEVYAKEAQSDPFCALDRFAEGLDSWMTRPGWTCTVAYDHDQPVGYAYGAPLPPASRWWSGLLTDTPADTITETGTRTYALSELMVRAPWRKTGTARRLHDALLIPRPEQRATLLVLQEHPKVRALYESWGWQTLGGLRPTLPAAPLFHAMLLDLPPHDGTVATMST
ncbi:GNAT family N-acetyltransferase [Streptomyces sp. ML-6]|uniref:GNAT family N-acetyltransferase n=1 Tax=Streptomyces sp. ML-6 TaxID=2982693 RepID=UPI0024C05791|nr:GNAT family N-acetyltransferase [Streptomyces sp. ML-6]MDK0517496.1 GNAT family N-acetyltransferase [Streptomyces sp. ML-6]MDK0524006.1 GNAT family N-acetyltransferase [Streptomyces sp. ML-6]MDK0524780.1 GNAT family N-acetyltransferase [Streptomyces sp. ML-6]MDK0524885.1 GNAT family N-acetyltransferase [Streptomyces sp. ML-6]